MTRYRKKYGEIFVIIFIILILILLLNSRCGAPKNVWSVKMESIYSREVLELKLRAQVYDGAPSDGLITFWPMMPTTLEDIKIIAEDDNRVTADIIRDGLLISKENRPGQIDYFYVTKAVGSKGREHGYWLTNLGVWYRALGIETSPTIEFDLLFPLHVLQIDTIEASQYGQIFRGFLEGELHPLYSEYNINYLYDFYHKSGIIDVTKQNNAIILSNIPDFDYRQKISLTHRVKITIIDQGGEKYVKITTLS